MDSELEPEIGSEGYLEFELYWMFELKLELLLLEDLNFLIFYELLQHFSMAFRY